MAPTYRIYGHGDDREDVGFPSPQRFRNYIAGEIFADEGGRYRYSETSFADTIVLSRKGKAYGHFEIERAEEPIADDLVQYDRTKRVFIVKKSVLYNKAVVLKDLGFIVKQRGLVIDQAGFDTILSRAEGSQSFSSDAPYPRKFCRVCYNTNDWRKPAGVAEEGGSYFSQNGFGHEEWLFRYDWCIDGKKYGFLQPFTRYLSNYQGSTFSLKLYTNHRGRTHFVGIIKKVYVPDDEELSKAYAHMEKMGWIDVMREEVAAVRGNAAALGNNAPNLVINVRFDPADVTFFADLPEFPRGTQPSKATRYNLYNDDEEVRFAPPRQPLTEEQREKLRLLRKAQETTFVDLIHVDMQDRLYRWLRERHGTDAVRKEFENVVDLRLQVDGEITFFELKTDDSAQRCIRSAMGQLFEYATYPVSMKATRWVVVGDKRPTQDDQAYLRHLRTKFGLPIYYAKFCWKTGGIGDPV